MIPTRDITMRDWAGRWTMNRVNDPAARHHYLLRPHADVPDMTMLDPAEANAFYIALRWLVREHELSWYGMVVLTRPGQRVEVHVIQGDPSYGTGRYEFQVHP